MSRPPLSAFRKFPGQTDRQSIALVIKESYSTYDSFGLRRERQVRPP